MRRRILLLNKKYNVCFSPLMRTNLRVSIRDESDQLVILHLENFIEHLADDVAAGWLAVDDAAAVELLEYPEEHRAVGRDVVAGVGRL